MRFPKGLRFPALSVISASIIIFGGVFLTAVLPNAARADTKPFVTQFHADSFDTAAAASAQSTAPTASKVNFEETGLMPEPDAAPFEIPALWSAPASAFFTSYASGSRPGEERFPGNLAMTGYSGLRRGPTDGASAIISPASYYGVGGFFPYESVPASAGRFGDLHAGVGPSAIDLGSGYTHQGDLKSSDGPAARSNGAAPRIMWPARVMSSDPVSVPEPSSLLMLACGILAVGLLRRLQPAK